MSRWKLILRSLVHGWRIHLAVMLGVVAATAVLTGALLVGDSVRGSLRDITLDRLGRFDAVLVTPTFFRAALADEVRASDGFSTYYADAIPAIFLQGTLDRPSPTGTGGGTARASGVSVLGIDERFWQQSTSPAPPQLKPNEVILNQPLATELQAKVGDRVLLRLPQMNDIPADSALGRKIATSRSRNLTVSAIIPATGLGRFSLSPSQLESKNAFVSTETLQSLLDQPGKVNAILVASREVEPGDGASLAAGEEVLKKWLRPQLADYGIRLAATPRGYLDFNSDQMLIPPAASEAIFSAFAKQQAQPVLVYLANYILAGDKTDDGLRKGKIPYSTVAGIDVTTEPPLGPLETADGPLTSIGDDEIVLNRWAADDLRAQGVDVQPGGPIELIYFEPESTHGEVKEQRATFKLKAVVEMSGAAADKDLTPELEGVTDQESIDNWDPPFPYDSSRVRSVKPNDQDEAYWDEYRATPKAFVSLATARKLWSSRFGSTTSIRVPIENGLSADAAAKQVQIDPAKLGFQFLPVKRLGLEASAGTTPFDLLFLGFSFFIIAAAILLIALLFKLGIDQRADQIGLLLACGISQQRTRGILLREGMLVAVAGSAIGVLVGISYAALMIAGLRTWWVDAISTPFLQLHITSRSLWIGALAGIVIAVLTIALSLRSLRKVSIRQLLAGQTVESRFRRHAGRWSKAIAIVLVVLAAILVGMAILLQGEARAGAFFGSGFLVLGGLLACVWQRLSGQSPRTASQPTTLPRLAWRNGARAPLRSTLTIGLIAAACFLIVAISAFRLSPSPDTGDRNSGSGGYQGMATSDQPIYQNLNDVAARTELGFDEEAEKVVAESQIIPLRVQSGDDASCLNLYSPRQPRVLGVTPAMIERGGFQWGDTAATGDAAKANPWLLLERVASVSQSGAAQPIPVVLDQNTALYSLHLSGKPGDRLTIQDLQGNDVELEVVGLLKNSIFQGDLLIGEADFKRLFPTVSGYRMFLVAEDSGTQHRASDSALATTLENSLGDYGLDIVPTADRLAALMAVQNTYLSTFQSLGGLGLLLGVFGLATVQLRSVLERRSELALMRAVGFRRRRLASMVLLENGSLLLVGLGVGVIAALVAISPNLLSGDAGLPIDSLAIMLLVILAAGLLAGIAAVRAVLRAPLVGALRGE